jgi:hypothetical protein
MPKYRVDFLDYRNMPGWDRKKWPAQRDLIVEVQAPNMESARRIALEQAHHLLADPRLGELKPV